MIDQPDIQSASCKQAEQQRKAKQRQRGLKAKAEGTAPSQRDATVYSYMASVRYTALCFQLSKLRTSTMALPLQSIGYLEEINWMPRPINGASGGEAALTP